MSEYNQVHLFYCEGADTVPHERVQWQARMRVKPSYPGTLEQHPDDGCFFCDSMGVSVSKWYKDI